MWLLRLKKLIKIMTDVSLIPPLLRGCAIGVEHLPVLQNFQCNCVVDIGANRGQFALAARKAFPDAQILSFEPLDEPLKIFKKVFDRDANVVLYPYAIGAEKKSSTIHITKDDDSSSMLPVTKTQTDLFPGAVEMETRDVMVYPLTQLVIPSTIPDDSLLKIDVQGFELSVLQGCEDVLDKFSHIYVECSFIVLYQGQPLAHQIIAWLEKRGFVLRSIHNLYYAWSGLAIQGDFLFTKKK